MGKYCRTPPEDQGKLWLNADFIGIGLEAYIMVGVRYLPYIHLGQIVAPSIPLYTDEPSWTI